MFDWHVMFLFMCKFIHDLVYVSECGHWNVSECGIDSRMWDGVPNVGVLMCTILMSAHVICNVRLPVDQATKVLDSPSNVS